MTIAANQLASAADLLNEHNADGSHGNTKSLTIQYGTTAAPTTIGHLYYKTSTGRVTVGSGSTADDIVKQGFDAQGQATFGDGGTTNYTKFAPSTGYQTMLGTARVVKRLRFHAGMMSDGATPGTPTAVNDYLGYALAIGNSHKVAFTVPEDIDITVQPTVAVVWAINEAYSLNSGEVRFAFAYSNTPTDETEDVTAPTHTGDVNGTDQNIPAVANRLTLTTIGSLPNLAGGDFVGLDVSRIALTAGNNPTANPILFEIRVEYTSDRLGIQSP